VTVRLAVRAEGEAACRVPRLTHDNPRIAGRAETSDTVECQVVVPDRDACAVSFTDDQWRALLEIFHDEVCDWSRPGAGEVLSEDAWIQV
jgi:hypothetical protein